MCIAFPRGRRGANRALIQARAKTLLQSLIQNRDTNARLELIQRELLQSYLRGCENGHEWRIKSAKGALGHDAVSTALSD